ncbi:phage holin [Staphylococcus simulans]|uniref:phage holin n=1 Tax=Staphylococcus simulans TaxID=1286 RepID=UPI000D1D2FDC|nr:phage holin [Staphylococcus simulans]PTI99575.1 phage holin [Staphylococcus simulans]PTJ39439.1 phage holin [Staphylococcus simulans]PTJ92275.1 phage holin [Staphylococcus simulans]RIN47958.1 phage holin [Staphylococcus simulans]
MNWKLRIKNKTVLTGLIGALLLFIKQITELLGLDLSTQLEQISALAGTIITLLVGLGVIVDPTTKGVKDSGIVKLYAKPRDSNNTDEMVQWQNQAHAPEVQQFRPEQYDTSKPFVDDSDEIGFDVNQYEHGGGSNDSNTD